MKYEIGTTDKVWAIITAHFTENWGFYTLLTRCSDYDWQDIWPTFTVTYLTIFLFSLPMFMRDVLKYDLDTSGILAAFPYVLMAIVVQVEKLLVQSVLKTENSCCSCECWTGRKGFLRSSSPLYPHGHSGPDALEVLNNVKIWSSPCLLVVWRRSTKETFN